MQKNKLVKKHNRLRHTLTAIESKIDKQNSKREIPAIKMIQLFRYAEMLYD